MSDGTVLLPIRPTTKTNLGGRGRRVRRRDYRGRARSVRTSPGSRRTRSEFLRWALRSGRPVDVDAAVVLIDVFDHRLGHPILLTDEMVADLVWVDAVHWCECRGVELPSGFARTLHATLDFLVATSRVILHHSSLAELHDFVDGIGAPSPPRSRRTPRSTA